MIAAAVAAGVTLFAGGGHAGDLFQGLRLYASDALFPSDRLDPRIAIVGIDRRSVLELAQPWPWPRSIQATLVRNLTASGARQQVLDFLYHPATDQDSDLADALRYATDVVTASTAELVRPEAGPLYEARVMTDPVDPVAQHAAVGHGNITPDPADGVVRSLPLAVVGGGRQGLVPALSLAALARLDGFTGPLIVRPGGLQVGNRLVPTGEFGVLNINYSAALRPGGPRLSYVSAVDVVRGRVPPRQLEGRIVLVGVVDPALGDQHLTPDDKVGGLPGVFVHANALNTMLTNTYLTPASGTYTLAWVAALTFLVALATQFLPVWTAALIALGTATAYVLFAFARFDGGLVVDLVYPNGGMAGGFVASLAVRYGSEARQRRRLADVLSQYVPVSVARQLLERDREGLPTGTITFLFTDVASSTATWENEPLAMSRAMRRHDAIVEQAVEAHGGAVVRPRGEGDSRFAVFVRPEDAVRAAADLAVGLAGEHWPTTQPIRVRTALHTGEADLREGDYYGSPVNRCARMRSLAEPGQVLVSSTTAELVNGRLPAGVELRHLGTRALKDIAEPQEILELVVGRSHASLTAGEPVWSPPAAGD